MILQFPDPVATRSDKRAALRCESVSWLVGRLMVCSARDTAWTTSKRKAA
jgi:hypothetical protein